MPEQIKLIYVFDLLEKGIDVKKIASLIENKVWILDAFGADVHVANDEERTAVLNELQKFKYYNDSPYELDIDKKGLYSLIYKWREADNQILDHPFANAGWPAELIDKEKLELFNTLDSSSDIEQIGVKEKKSLQKMILGMAILKYDYDPNALKNQCTGDNKFSIQADLQKCGIDMDNDTIRKYLKEAASEISFNIPQDKT